jgi:hypothetical protein
MLQKLDSKIFQVHLNGAGMSGRGVRFRLLSPEEKRKSDGFAADKVGPQASGVDYFNMRLHEGMKSALTAVTEKYGLSDPFADDVKWQDVNYTMLSTPGGDWNLESGDVFTPADIEILTGLYRLHHEPSQLALAQIMGEAKAVA